MINKKLKNKKGFTIVELVIVIAVIAILAAVLIPTFTNVVKNARVAAAQSTANSAYTQYMAEVAENDEIETNLIIVCGDYQFKVTNGSLNTTPLEEKEAVTDTDKYEIVWSNVTTTTEENEVLYTADNASAVLYKAVVAEDNTDTTTTTGTTGTTGTNESQG